MILKIFWNSIGRRCHQVLVEVIRDKLLAQRSGDALQAASYLTYVGPSTRSKEQAQNPKPQKGMAYYGGPQELIRIGLFLGGGGVIRVSP